MQNLDHVLILKSGRVEIFYHYGSVRIFIDGMDL